MISPAYDHPDWNAISRYAGYIMRGFDHPFPVRIQTGIRPRVTQDTHLGQDQQHVTQDNALV